MISLQSSMHSSQMYTPGPATNFRTCSCVFPQNEHFRRSRSSPNLNIDPAPLWVYHLSATGGRDQLSWLDHVVDEAVILGFHRTHPEVPLRVALHALQRLCRMLGQHLVEDLPDRHEL